jgi:HlyD family secretion protein
MIRDTSATDRVIAAPKASRRRTALVAAAVVVLLLLTGFAVPSMQRWLSASRSVSGERLRVAEVRRGTLVRDVSAQARVVAAVAPTLYAPAAGTVTFRVRAGDTVARDQVLAVLASPELESQRDRERATLESLEVEVSRARIQNKQAQLTARRTADQAEVDLAAAEREWQRAEQAFSKGAMSKVDYLTAKDNLRKAELSNGHAQQDAKLQAESLAFELRTRELALERQRVVVAELERQVDSLAVRAPVDGQVANLAVADRANVPLNQALLTVVDLSALELEIRVPESFADDLGLGMHAEIRYGDRDLPGTVSSVAPEVVEGQVTGRIRFAGAQPAGLRQNQRLTTRILIEERPNVLIVDRGPFLDADGGRVAYVVDDGVATRRPIEVGAGSLAAVEIVSGLAEGEHVIVSSTAEFEGADKVLIR